MQREQVSSSNIRSIGYDGVSMILEVEFLNGSVYQYRGVPSEVHIGLMQAPSHGQYLNRYVKGTYAYTRIA
jgi:hypothetical protein